MRIVKTAAILLVATVASLLVFVQLAPKTAFHLATNLERSLSNLETKRIELPSGLEYVYLEGGSGPALMLLHGFGADKDNFTRVARLLTPHYRVIVPDHIGFGESSHPMSVAYDSVSQARRLRELAQALGVGEVHLGGSSMGGHIALSYAATYPEEVASLWLLAPGGVWSATKSELFEIYESSGENPLMPKNTEDFEKVFDFAMSDPPFFPRAFLAVMAEARLSNAALENKVFEDINADSVEERVRGLETPSLIVWGMEDRALHVDAADVLHALLPNSEVIKMEAIGHLPMIESPQRSAADYLSFRERTAAN